MGVVRLRLAAGRPRLASTPARRVAGTGAGRLPAWLREIALGLLVGVLLGAHLLVTAARTLGYAVGAISPGAYLAALAYDAGASALSAAWFFHGGLFRWLWGRIDFWRAAAAATAAALVRYLLDPALPRAAEAAAGAVFYLAVLGMACCAIRALDGQRGPGVRRHARLLRRVPWALRVVIAGLAIVVAAACDGARRGRSLAGAASSRPPGGRCRARARQHRGGDRRPARRRCSRLPWRCR